MTKFLINLNSLCFDNGTTVHPVSYSFIDQDVKSGRFSYRLKQVDLDGSYKYSNVISAELGLPETFSLSQNYPNPFNPSTKVDYQVASESRVKIELYSITGQKVGDIINSDHAAGFYSVTIDADSFNGIASGMYIYRMTAVSKSDGKSYMNIKKMVFMK